MQTEQVGSEAKGINKAIRGTHPYNFADFCMDLHGAPIAHSCIDLHGSALQRCACFISALHSSWLSCVSRTATCREPGSCSRYSHSRATHSRSTPGRVRPRLSRACTGRAESFHCTGRPRRMHRTRYVVWKRQRKPTLQSMHSSRRAASLTCRRSRRLCNAGRKPSFNWKVCRVKSRRRSGRGGSILRMGRRTRLR